MKRLALISIGFLFFACGGNEETNNNSEVDENATDTSSVSENNLEVEQVAREKDYCEYTFLEDLNNEISQTAKVEPIGLFDSTWVVGEESVNGFNIKLWRVENDYIGFMNQYQGSPEPYRSGPIVFGRYIEKSELKLVAYLKLSKGFSDWESSEPVILTISSKLTEEALKGTMENKNCVTGESSEYIPNSINLLFSDMWGPLEEYENIQA